MTAKLDDQGVFRTKDGIRVEVWVSLHKQVGRDRRKTACRNEQVNVGRAERMTPKRAEHLPNGSIVCYGVGDGFDSHKAVASLAVGAELAAQIHLGLLGVLLLVQPVFVGLPDVEQGTSNGCPIGR